jgi:hypothetical protein
MRKYRTKKSTTVESDGAVVESDGAVAARDVVERLAYQYWLERGCPEGSAGEDWFRAERALQAKESHPALIEAVMRAAG